MSGPETQARLSPWWRRSALGVMIFGFSILIFLTFQTYRKAPPIPSQVVDEGGAVLYTAEDVGKGQEVFFKYGLMEHGSLWGHGAYLGPDYSAAYLRREAEITRDALAASRFGKEANALDEHQRASVLAEVKEVLKTNRYDTTTGVLLYTAGEAHSFAVQQAEWAAYLAEGAPGLPASYLKGEGEARVLTAFLAWSSWAARANRPGRTYSYTSNWPYDPLAGNTPTAQAILWSAVSLVFLLGGLGAILFFFGKFDFLGWKGDRGERPAHLSLPKAAALTPSQRITALFFLVVVLLFLLQVFLGGALAHYRVEPEGFYGYSLADLLPYNLARTWHLQLAIFWIATAWVGGGLFLAPLLGGREPKGQKWGGLALLGALAVVVFGSLFGEYLGINDRLGDLWFWFGHQGSEYVDLGRFWQVLLAAGLVFWLLLMVRALAPAFRDADKRELAGLFLFASVAVVIFYLPAFLWGARTNFAVIDNWRFWIIHLWVEGFFELFATVLVALMFVHMGLVRTVTAGRVIYLDAILYLAGGIAGTAHHWYFTGQEAVSMAIGACFSALEVVPLTLLTLDAWDFIKLQKEPCADCGKPLALKQKWAVMFLIAVGFWNFLGAGVFGFLINLPIVSYFEMGTTLTPNHGHAAMFGVFGMLALAVLVYCLRALASDGAWGRAEKFIRAGFWGLNAGLGLMIVLNLFPAGVLQLYDVVLNGYAHARSVEFTMTGLFHTTEWVRLAGDMTLLFAGAVPFAIGATLAVFGILRERPEDARQTVHTH
ncbi:MAG: cbb3-type cytochrome c oxidase subunit I [Acidobacteriota bacterium]